MPLLHPRGVYSRGVGGGGGLYLFIPLLKCCPLDSSYIVGRVLSIGL